MTIPVKCPNCHQVIDFQQGAIGKQLACPWCNQPLLTVVEDEPAPVGAGLALVRDTAEVIAEPQRDRLMKLAIVGCGAGLGMFVVALFAVAVLLLRAPGEELAAQHSQPNAMTPAGLAKDEFTRRTVARSAHVKQPELNQPTSSTVESPIVPARRSDWSELHEAGRLSQSWLYVNLTPRSDGSRTARFRSDGRKLPFSERSLGEGQGVPLFECSPFQLKYRGWAGAASKPTDETQRNVLQSERETEIYRICKLSDFGTGSFHRGNDSQQSFDHRHVWSPDGEYLYVLTGLRQGVRKHRLCKVNTRTWEIELEIRPHEDLADLTWTAQGLVLIADPPKTYESKFAAGETWVQLVPSNQQLERYEGGILLLDADTLAVRRAWVTPRVQEVAGQPGSDLIYLRSPQAAILVVNVESGELMSCYSYNDLLGDDGDAPLREDLHFLHPRLSADGSSVTTHGMNNVVADPRRNRVAKNSLGPRSVNRFRVSGANIEWEQTTRVGGVRSRFTRRCDVGVGEDYLCLPQQRFEIVSANEIRVPLAKLSLPPEAAVVVESSSRTIFLCWPDWMARQLAFRTLRGTTDTEVILADGIEPVTDATKFSGSNFPEEARVHRNLWPFEMSAAPNGRGAIVFTPAAAYWVEPKFGPGTKWAFNGSPGGDVATGDRQVVGDHRQDHKSATVSDQWAETLTQCKAATALLLVPSKDKFGSAFCIDEQGFFLTNAYHVEGLAIDSEVSLVLQAGSFHERATQAKILRIDPSVGVALLKTDPHADLVPLQLGQDEALTEAAPLTAFGYTRVPQHETSVGRYPCVGAKPGVATALRKSEEALVTIQFNGVLLPGNSGGPVIDAEGQVVGIVRSGIELLGLNFLIPVSQLKRLEWPELGRDPRIVRNRPVLDRRPLTEPAKDATALVVLPNEKGFGTAFCVDRRGFFATNAHVVEGVSESDVVTLVLRPGEVHQHLATARVVRTMKASDLALLELVVQQDDLTALEIDDSTTLTAQMEVRALGFPFGNALAVRGQKFPSVSVNVARIEAVTTTTLGHEAFEFHTQLNPGNSGGPVVNAKGKVVGVVFATQLGARKSYAIPVARLRELMFAPDITWKVLAVDYPDRRRITAFPITVTPYLRSLDGLELAVSLKPEYGPEKTYPMSASESDGNYVARIPLIAPDIPDYVKATFHFNAATISGTVADHEVKIGAATYRLSTAPEGAFLGDQLVTGLESLSVGIGKAKYTIDGSRAISATIQPFPPSCVTYTVVARQDGREVARSSGPIDVSIRHSSELRTHRFAKQIVQAWSEGGLAKSLPPLKVTATFAEGSISGLAANRRFQVIRLPTSEEYDLSEVNWIKEQLQDDAAGNPIRTHKLDLTGVGRQSNRSTFGSQLPGLEQVPLRVGESEVVVDLTAANSVVVEPIQSGVTRFPLNTRIADVAAGGGGKWLILHLPQLGKLVVFDVLARRIVHQIPLAEEKVLFAAGAKKLLVVFPELKAIQRWDLASGRHEMAAEFSRDGIIGAVAMGCGGSGPLLMHGYDAADPPQPHWTLVDMQSLESSRLEARLPESIYPKSPPLTSSVDGTVFGSLDLALVLRGESAEEVSLSAKSEFPANTRYAPFLVTPGTSGQQLFYRNSIYSTKGEMLVGAAKFSVGVPTYDENYSLSFHSSNTGARRLPQVTICQNKAATLRPLVAFEAFANPQEDRLPSRKRYHFYLASRLLVTIPLSDDVLLLNELPAWK